MKPLNALALAATLTGCEVPIEAATGLDPAVVSQITALEAEFTRVCRATGGETKIAYLEDRADIEASNDEVERLYTMTEERDRRLSHAGCESTSSWSCNPALANQNEASLVYIESTVRDHWFTDDCDAHK
ncbi:hypothetical protein HY463_01555 [Candidatus Peregrinibacteria bacterium]|nr:hypothetical protein [Candidatus Peregrinibacteria bacterium]